MFKFNKNKKQEILKKKKILIVDDDETIREVLENVLKNSGYDVILCEDALRVIGSIQYENKPDLIVLDIMMEFMNGLEIFEQLKNIKEYADIPVIIITAMESERVKQKALEMGAVEFLQKPFNLDFFINKVNHYIK